MAIDTDTTFRCDLNALAGNEDVATTTALTKIAQDANGGKATPVVHASDKSYDELVAEYKGVGANKADVVDIVADGGHVGLAVLGGAGQDKATFFAAHPALAQRYANDIAFKNGFDAMVWAKERGGQATYDQTVNDLRTRDGWYSSAGVSMRG